ncbi:MAG: depupylase/deamidase Dop [Nocardioides sp.]
MSVHRVMGTEVEYGISVVGQPFANPMVASSQVVNAYASLSAQTRRARWDFEEESPLRDVRGWERPRSAADPSQLTDEDLGLANVILTNGARLYVDHAHPEYSSPEVTNPLDVVRWDKTGELVMLAAIRRAATVPGGLPIALYKNNTDNKGASYGAHENYLVPRATPFSDIVRHLVPFFVTRQIICGAGRVGIGHDGRGDGFQISQRADFFEVEVGLETTLKRPIINTRDEPHADPERHRRLHVILGDANLSEVSGYLKMGTTALVLAMIEDDFIAADLSIDNPIGALRAVSHDPGLTQQLTLKDGRTMTGLQLQWEYHDLAHKYVDQRFGADADPQTRDVLDRWAAVLSGLAEDIWSCADQLDWVAKWRLLTQYRERDGLAWSDAKLQLVDLQYSDIRPEKGLYHRLVAAGRMETLLDEASVEHAVAHPPTDTRAYFRGRCLAKYPMQVAAASWDSVIFDLADGEPLQRIPTLDPLRGTHRHVAALLDRCASARELVTALTSPAA